MSAGSENVPLKKMKKHCLPLNQNVFLAPMVRIGTLPFRILSLRMGADLVWSDEIIDIKLLRTRRMENELSGTIDYVLDDGTVVFQTCEEERGKNVLQIGTSSADRAARVVAHIDPRDVAAIDLNMGCPKPFSLKGGMGAALLKQKENVRDILSAMVREASVPITCKIRILPNLEDAVEIAKIAESCGVSAITVHGRTPLQESTEPLDENAIAKIAQSVSIPVIANGASGVISTRADAEAFRQRTKTCSVMLARCALENPSVFHPNGPCSHEKIVPEFIELATQYLLPTHLLKYALSQLISGWRTHHGTRENNVKQKWMNAAISSNTISDMLPSFGFPESFVIEYTNRFHKQCEYWRVNSNLDGLITISVDHDEKTFMVGGGNSPKDLLHAFCMRRNLGKPAYESFPRDDRQFTSVVTIGEKKYTSGRIEQRKRVSEQTAALAALIYLDAFT